jgi:hypothetical protein
VSPFSIVYFAERPWLRGSAIYRSALFLERLSCSLALSPSLTPITGLSVLLKSCICCLAYGCGVSSRDPASTQLRVEHHVSCVSGQTYPALQRHVAFPKAPDSRKPGLDIRDISPSVMVLPASPLIAARRFLCLFWPLSENHKQLYCTQFCIFFSRKTLVLEMKRGLQETD